ncbi:MAG TPA: SRPBCC family protein [Terracidiphilus sp.]|jgi:ligand-binding SRPBCC domain-containing protein
MVKHFETSQWVPYPVELVFAFFANPHNLPPLMPPEVEARIEDMRITPPPPRPVPADPSRRFQSLAAGAGSELLISFKPAKFLPRVSWTAHIEEFEWNSHFLDEMIRGPFKTFRHRHGIAPEVRNREAGTCVTDSIDFELPGGIVGVLAARKVWNQLQQSFAFRQKRLPEILAIAARQATRSQ